MKNSWGTARPDRGNVPGFPGYHDMAIDTRTARSPGARISEEGETECLGSTQPLRTFLPPRDTDRPTDSGTPLFAAVARREMDERFSWNSRFLRHRHERRRERPTFLRLPIAHTRHTGG